MNIQKVRFHNQTSHRVSFKGTPDDLLRLAIESPSADVELMSKILLNATDRFFNIQKVLDKGQKIVYQLGQYNDAPKEIYKTNAIKDWVEVNKSLWIKRKIPGSIYFELLNDGEKISRLMQRHNIPEPDIIKLEGI